MKKFISILFVLTIVICTSIPVSVNAETTDGYGYYIDDGKATIVGTYGELSGDIEIPSTLGGYPVTSIESHAFDYCRGLTSIIIPDTVTSIGRGGFEGCTNLQKITLPFIGGNNTAENAFLGYIFGANSYLQNMGYIPTSLKEVIVTSADAIYENAFFDCSNLTVISLPDSVTFIGSSAFEDCSNLTDISIPDNVTFIGDSAFENCSNLTNISIPDGVISIGSFAFYDTPYYNDLNNWDNNVLYIGNHLIEANYDITGSYIIRPNTKTIASKAFFGCSSLTDISIPNGVTSIGSFAFGYCPNLTNIAIPDTVTSIGRGVFEDCTNIHKITLPFIGGNNTAENAFLGYIFGADSYEENADFIPNSLKEIIVTSTDAIYENAFFDCSNLADISLPDSVTFIGNSAFYGCSNLTGIFIPDNVTFIGDSAFYGCSNLTGISIPNGVTFIGSSAFEDCSKLTSITVPDAVAYIGKGAFDNCTNLKEITLPFIGSSRTANSTSDAIFGYIFGDYDDNPFELETVQKYSTYLSEEYGIPATLKKVTITDAEIIPYGAFYGCNAIDNIIINTDIKTIYPKAFHYCENLLDLTLPVNSPKISSENIFVGCYMLTIHGIENSKIHTYANTHLIDFIAINGPEIETGTLDTAAEVIEGKIVVTVTTKLPTFSRFMPVALYDKNNVMLDLITIPTNQEFDVLKVVFKDNPLAHYAKAFHCNSFEDLTPLIDAKEIEITR